MFIWYRVPTYSGVTTVFPASIWVSTQSTFISLSFRRWAVRHTPFTKFVLESSDKHVCLFQLCEIITTFFRRWGIVLFSGCTCKTGSEDVANWRLTLKAKCRDRTFRGRTLSYELYVRVVWGCRRRLTRSWHRRAPCPREVGTEVKVARARRRGVLCDQGCYHD